ncbi:MAG: hypothetical protein CM1200mP12_21110 [Gammaproteobacteria bacterium]|nr:MAG: hypothetical protein CM1200mP12_21110 [Gammaproteobacteria bacterium]
MIKATIGVDAVKVLSNRLRRSHEGTDFLPKKVTFEENKEVYFCGCKNSSNGAFCDGTHKNL